MYMYNKCRLLQLYACLYIVKTKKELWVYIHVNKAKQGKANEALKADS